MKALIAYYSRSGQNYVGGSIVELPVGNTKVAAQMIADLSGAGMFEIDTVEKYPIDYRACTEAVADEKAEGARPKLVSDIDIEAYDVIFLCYPNWWGTCPMAVFTFLEAHDFDGKTIMPLCANEGSGMGSSEGDIRRACPGADIRSGLSIRGGSVSGSKGLIENWLKKAGF